MDEFTYCPIPTDDGSTCWNEPEPDGYANICHDHMHAIVRAWSYDIKLSRTRCTFCGSIAAWLGRTSRVTYCANCLRVITVPDCLVEENRPTPEARDTPASRRARPVNVVYYIRFADRVKIGTTGDLRRRMMEIPHEELLAIEPGDDRVERGRHSQFAESHIPQYREWFAITPGLVSHINELRRKFGPPVGAWQKWRIEAMAA